jgi:hypothetical protein
MPLVECWCMHIPHRLGKAKWSGPHHNIKILHFVSFHSVTCYTDSMVSRIHVNPTKLRNIMCTLIATGVIIRNLECNSLSPLYLTHINPRLFWSTVIDLEGYHNKSSLWYLCGEVPVIGDEPSIAIATTGIPLLFFKHFLCHGPNQGSGEPAVTSYR